MGVTVQRMVDAEVSGVLFTCNPVSGDPSTVAVNASWGLGLAVVGGEVTPDEYRVSKVTREVLHRAVASKHVEYVPAPAAPGRCGPTCPRQRRDAACLTTSSSARWSIWRAGSSATSAATRTSSGRSRATAATLRPPVAAGHGRAAKPAPAPPRASAIDLVMGTFGAKR